MEKCIWQGYFQITTVIPRFDLALAYGIKQAVGLKVKRAALNTGRAVIGCKRTSALCRTPFGKKYSCKLL